MWRAVRTGHQQALAWEGVLDRKTAVVEKGVAGESANPSHSASSSHRAVEQPFSIHGHVVTQLGTLDGNHTEPHGDQIKVGWGWREGASVPQALHPHLSSLPAPHPSFTSSLGSQRG